MTSAEIAGRLRAYLPAQEYALFFEVPNSTGGGRGYADAVAISLWPSRGHTIIGYEFKVSTSDLNRELATPAKADVVGKYCDYWFLVTPPGLIKKAKYPLPGTWGLLEATGDTLRQKVSAPRLTPTGTAAPKELPRHFAAALLRRAQAQALAPMEVEVERRVKIALDQYEARDRLRRESNKSKNDTLHARVSEFENASGINLSDSWTSGRQLAEDVALARRLRSYGGPPFADILHQLDATSTTLRALQEKLK